MWQRTQGTRLLRLLDGVCNEGIHRLRAVQGRHRAQRQAQALLHE
jgi:hypothetical protein